MRAFVLCLLTFLPLTAVAGPADYVYTPNVEYGERELDFKIGNQRGGGQERLTAASLGLGFSVTERWFTEIYTKFEKPGGESARIVARVGLRYRSRHNDNSGRTTMFTRFSRSWQLIKASGAVLREDKELLLFPFFSAIATLLVSASFIVPLIVTGAFEQAEAPASDGPVMIFVFLFYLVQYFIIFFFNFFYTFTFFCYIFFFNYIIIIIIIRFYIHHHSC